MKRITFILSLIISPLCFSQTSEPGVTSTASASGNHAFVGTYSNSTFSNWLDTGDSATNYNLLGYSQKYAGFGVANGSNIVSPIIWMYANHKNAFRVRTMNYNGDMTTGTDLFTVRANGNIGIGTTSPDEKLHVNGTATITGDIGAVTNSHWNTGAHTLELQNSDAGDVVLSFHRAGYTNAAIKHSPLGGLIFSGSGAYNANHVYLKSNGDLGIGTTDTQGFKLGVEGKIAATEVKIAAYGNWSDFVFESNYKLPTLKEVEQYIKENGHLKEIPSAEEVKKDGFFLGEMDSKLLQKIEELTLYTIRQQKDIEAQNNKIECQSSEIGKLKKENKELQSLSSRLAEIEKLFNNKN